ncbi:MarR family winged helix-turn-helix transcriptional regulator [Tsukamurella ocularis]|uniref:MarR family winged helix-turn-helix transcriptional regulator n=1 Tax=Tsukamurella ocularis TaxID=1970234 RepID=UPI0039F12865
MSRGTSTSTDSLAIIDPGPNARIHLLARRVGVIVADLLLDQVRRYEPGLRTGHMRVLALIDARPVRIVDVAAELGTTKQTVAPTVDELVSWGFVARTVDETDRRARILTLTPEGEELTRAMLDTSIALDEEWGRLLGPDVEVCRSALWRIIESQKGRGDHGVS